MKTKIYLPFAHAKEAAKVNLKRIASPKKKTESPLAENKSSIINHKNCMMKKALHPADSPLCVDGGCECTEF